jgi:hypothetical protein
MYSRIRSSRSLASDKGFRNNESGRSRFGFQGNTGSVVPRHRPGTAAPPMIYEAAYCSRRNNDSEQPKV